MKPKRELPAALLIAAVARLPFLLEGLRTPVDGDEAIIGLMARHVGRGLTFWGTSYLSPLEAWLAAPLVEMMGPTQAPLRVFYFLLSLLLVPLAYFLAAALAPRAALSAALMMAVPSPYFLLMAALPPTVYPTILILCGLLLLITIHSDGRLAARPWPWAALWGALAGLAVWTHLMTATVVFVCAAYLALRTRRGWLWLAAALVPLLACSAPWWTHTLRDRRSLGVVSVASRDETLSGHVMQVLPLLHRPLGGIVGTHAPMIADASDHIVEAPLLVAVGLALVHGLGFLWAIRIGHRRPEVVLLLAVVTLCVLVFPLPLRSNPDAIRYLTPIYLPLLVLLAWTGDAIFGRRGGLALALSLGLLHCGGARPLLEAWQGADRAEAPFLLPDLAPARAFLEAHRVQHAYASYAPAYRLTYESGERLVVSQPWNERFPDEPLPYLDEVRFAKDVAWIVTPTIPSRLASRERFEAELDSAGGAYQRAEVGAAVIYYDFAPPFGSRVVSLVAAGPAGDGDLATRLLEPIHGASLYRLSAPTPLDAITLLAPHGELRLLKSMDVEVSADGTSFQVVTQRRRIREYRDLRWVGGHPQYVTDDDLIAVPLYGRTVAALRITPINSNQAWAIGEILLHMSAAAAAGPWDEWLPPGVVMWADRAQALAADPRRGREDWYYRSLLAERHR